MARNLSVSQHSTKTIQLEDNVAIEHLQGSLYDSNCETSVSDLKSQKGKLVIHMPRQVVFCVEYFLFVQMPIHLRAQKKRESHQK